LDKNMKILITGSEGLVGSEAVSFFKKSGWEVVGVDNNMRSYFFGVEGEYHNDPFSDIRNEDEMNELFSLHKFDAIIHAAAQPSHDWAQKEPLTDFDVNARGTLILLEATRKYCPEAVFVHVSTDKVYGENMTREVEEKETRYSHWDYFGEDTPIDYTTHSLFGCSKLSADLYAQEYARYFGLKVGIFRPGCITGRNHKGAELHGFLAYLTKCIKEEKEYRVFGFKGKQVRDQIHAYDLVNAFYHFILHPTPGEVYNIGGGEERSVSVLEAIKLIEHETGKKAIVKFLSEERKGDRIWDIHDVSRFRTHYPDWEYEYSLEDIIKDLCRS
jgi:CDP-paratose 2-epimerase